MNLDKAKVLGCLQEISNSLTRIEAERDLIKEILQKMQDECEPRIVTGKQIGRAHV